jgi:hypothetical protein
MASEIGERGASRWTAVLGATLAAAAGCAGPGAGGTLRVEKIEAVAQQPSNVAAYFTVHEKTGAAILDLGIASFQIYEDGKLISEKKAKRALVDPGPAEAQYTLILLDVSGPIVDSEDYPDLVSGVGRLVETSGRSQAAVSLFDGGDEIVPMLGFGASGEKDAFDAIRHFRPRSRSGNMNGAIVQGLDLLEKQLGNATAPFRYGSLVVVTDRGDVAHKVATEALLKRLAKTPVDVFVLAVGPGVDRKALEPVAKAGLYASTEPKDLAKGFTDMVQKVGAVGGGHYIFSYCTNKREGAHTLTLVVNTPDDHGRLIHKFSADEFRTGCVAKHRPVFDKPADKEKEKE